MIAAKSSAPSFLAKLGTCLHSGGPGARETPSQRRRVVRRGCFVLFWCLSVCLHSRLHTSALLSAVKGRHSCCHHGGHTLVGLTCCTCRRLRHLPSHGVCRAGSVHPTPHTLHPLLAYHSPVCPQGTHWVAPSPPPCGGPPAGEQPRMMRLIVHAPGASHPYPWRGCPRSIHFEGKPSTEQDELDQGY